MKATILLIEDNPQNRYLTKFLLEQCGHEVVEVETGPQGLELAMKIRPDLILLDIQLPGMDGHAVARALKSDPELRAIPIIAVTSYAMVGDREKCLAAGAEGYIEKPINPESFVAEIERFLPGCQPERSEIGADGLDLGRSEIGADGLDLGRSEFGADGLDNEVRP